MQIALTKKLADALGIKAAPATEAEDPLFSWTANWTTTWDNRRAEDMLVLVNHANRFTVAVYQVKRKDLKNITTIIKTAISNTLLSMNVQPEIIEEYLQRAGEITYVKNSNRKATAWVNQAGKESTFYVGRYFNGVDKMFDDTIGAFASNRWASDPNNPKEYVNPEQEMLQALTKLTGKPLYNYRAFELLLTLDLDSYQATRRIIVPADIKFQRLHNIIQRIFDWKNYHLYDFKVWDNNSDRPVARLVPFPEDLDYDPNAILMKDKTLDAYFPKYKHILYTYDMGDNWKHEIDLVRIIDNHTEDSPYLLEASGQTPPEDVGGVSGFNYFREIILDPEHPEHNEMKNWAGFWTPELDDWKKKPRLIKE